MNREKQIAEMQDILINNGVFNNLICRQDYAYPDALISDMCRETAEIVVNNGYRKMDEITLKLDLGDRSAEEIQQIAEAFNKANEEEITKRFAKEILQKVINICLNEEDYQDGTVNTQLEPLHFGIANGCAYVRGEVKELAKDYGVEIEK